MGVYSCKSFCSTRNIILILSESVGGWISKSIKQINQGKNETLKCDCCTTLQKKGSNWILWSSQKLDDKEC